MADRSLIGKETPAGEATASAEEIAAFCEAIGDVRPEYVDTAAGSGTLVPPTFPMRFLFDALDPDLFFELGLNLAGIVHAEQEFIYNCKRHGDERTGAGVRVFENARDAHGNPAHRELVIEIEWTR